MATILITPGECTAELAKRSRCRRLEQNLSQQTLSERSGVSLSVIKKFERSGKISLESLTKIAWALGCLEHFMELFTPKPASEMSSLDEVLGRTSRQRGRR